MFTYSVVVHWLNQWSCDTGRKRGKIQTLCQEPRDWTFSRTIRRVLTWKSLLEKLAKAHQRSNPIVASGSLQSSEQTKSALHIFAHLWISLHIFAYVHSASWENNIYEHLRFDAKNQTQHHDSFRDSEQRQTSQKELPDWFKLKVRCLWRTQMWCSTSLGEVCLIDLKMNLLGPKLRVLQRFYKNT